MAGRRVVSLSMPTAAIVARATTGLTGVPQTSGYVPRHLAPVAASPSKAATVKAGGVATLTGGDTTQPETQR